MPNEKVLRMVYHDGPFTLDAGVFGTPATRQFRANSIFDPDFTGVGHQPLGHDQMAALYNRYIVIGSKITCKFWSDTTSSNQTAAVGIMANDDTTSGVIGNLSELLENGKLVHRFISHRADITHPITLTYRWSAKKWFNVKDIKDNWTTYGAQIGFNPSDGCTFDIFNHCTSTLADPPALYCWVKIEYLVIFSQPKELAQS